MAGCSAAWARRVQSEILDRYPKVLVVQARAYDRTRVIDTDLGEVTLPAVERPTQEGPPPLTAIRKFLAQYYEQWAPPHSQVFHFHPLGGFSYIRQR